MITLDDLRALRAAWDAARDDPEKERAYQDAIKALTGLPCDAAFAHAVRQAATGLRTASKADPEKECAPLAAILRSDRELDADGLELMAQMVTGNLRAPQDGETDFAREVRRAHATWARKGRAKGRKGERDTYANRTTTGATLAAYLRAEVERIQRGEPPQIGLGERVMLAEMLCPTPALATAAELRGKPPTGAGHSQVVAVVEAFRKRIAAGELRKNALIDTEEEFELATRTVENYLSMMAKHEEHREKPSAGHSHVFTTLRIYRKLRAHHDHHTAAAATVEWCKKRNGSHYDRNISISSISHYCEITKVRETEIRQTRAKVATDT